MEKAMTGDALGKMDPPCGHFLNRRLNGEDWLIDCIRVGRHRGRHKTVSGAEWSMPSE